MPTFPTLDARAEGELGNGFRPQPVRRPADQIRLGILDAIISGQLKAGDRLPSEADQARGFKVSRAVVREALRSLAQLGIITVVQGRQGDHSSTVWTQGRSKRTCARR